MKNLGKLAKAMDKALEQHNVCKVCGFFHHEHEPHHGKHRR